VSEAAYLQRVQAAKELLGITPAMLAGRRLTLCHEPESLALVQRDEDGREHRLTPEAAVAWQRLRIAASADGVVLQLVSAFRSFDYQTRLIQRKLDAGMVIADILRGSACPGYSEHHTGRALDIDTPDNPGLGESFERTAAFAWLQAHAGARGFSLSFPRGNAAGYVYEPWHWLWSPPG
jgi:D-alanyl-D-alanine carboxypeptidase